VRQSPEYRLVFPAARPAIYQAVYGDQLPTKGGYFTRGTTKNAYAVYSEAGADYIYNMQRLRQKFETAKSLLPLPVLCAARYPARFAALFYGSTGPAMQEALDTLDKAQELGVRILTEEEFVAMLKA
jgi:2-oxoglutarate ferredoxin oxidoreductase subunit alpha